MKTKNRRVKKKKPLTRLQIIDALGWENRMLRAELETENASLSEVRKINEEHRKRIQGFCELVEIKNEVIMRAHEHSTDLYNELQKLKAESLWSVLVRKFKDFFAWSQPND